MEGINWMPVAIGKFGAIMRLYEPLAAALNNEYLLPRIEKVDNRQRLPRQPLSASSAGGLFRIVVGKVL